MQCFAVEESEERRRSFIEETCGFSQEYYSHHVLDFEMIHVVNATVAFADRQVQSNLECGDDSPRTFLVMKPEVDEPDVVIQIVCYNSLSTSGRGNIVC